MSITDTIELQNKEFDALTALAKQWSTLKQVPVVDDDYPKYRHRYEGAVKDFIIAIRANGRLEKEVKHDIYALHERMTGHLFPAYSNIDERFLALALCGEAGELANIVKKRWRDGADLTEEARDEIADVRVYLELLAKCFGIKGEKLDAWVEQKLGKGGEEAQREAGKKMTDSYNDGYTHEALHTTHILMEMLDTHVIDTICIEQFPDVKEAAAKAHQALFDLYQLIGTKLGEEYIVPTPSGPKGYEVVSGNGGSRQKSTPDTHDLGAGVRQTPFVKVTPDTSLVEIAKTSESLEYVESWVLAVTRADVLLPAAVRDILYVRWTKDFLVLEPAVTAAEMFQVERAVELIDWTDRTDLLKDINCLYRQAGDFFVLDIGACPPSDRMFWPVVPAEVSQADHEALQPWQRGLYARDYGSDKWRLRPEHVKWSVA